MAQMLWNEVKNSDDYTEDQKEQIASVLLTLGEDDGVIWDKPANPQERIRIAIIPYDENPFDPNLNVALAEAIERANLELAESNDRLKSQIQSLERECEMLRTEVYSTSKTGSLYLYPTEGA